jgi:hypothetical protein
MSNLPVDKSRVDKILLFSLDLTTEELKAVIKGLKSRIRELKKDTKDNTETTTC